MAGEQKGKAKAPAKKAVVKKAVKKTKAPEAKVPEASATPAAALPPEPKKFRNRALEVAGELHIMVHAQSGVDSKESFCQSQIVIDFENGDVMKNAAETILLPPERTRLLLKILGLDSLDFMKKHYGKEA